MTWQRARSEAQKEERVSEIVAATARLYEEYSFDEITLAQIARAAKFTRSNLYKYFSTKEDIFLSLLGQDLVHFRRALARSLRPGKVTSVRKCAAAWTKVLIKHERLLKLFSILYTSLEKKASLESLTQFKQTGRDELAFLTQLLCAVLPGLTAEQAGQFLHWQAALAIGLYPMAHVSDVQRRAMERAGYEQMGIDFPSYLSHAIEYLVRGLVG